MSRIMRGEMYYIHEDYSSVGSEMKAGRPAIIVSNDMNNEFSNTVEIRQMKPQPPSTPSRSIHRRFSCLISSMVFISCSSQQFGVVVNIADDGKPIQRQLHKVVCILNNVLAVLLIVVVPIRGTCAKPVNVEQIVALINLTCLYCFCLRTYSTTFLPFVNRFFTKI